VGYVRHHAIVVTSWSDDLIEHAHTEAVRIFGAAQDESSARTFERLVSPIVPAVTNGGSFFVAPDGSKEGWGTSDLGDACRARLIRHLEGYRYEDGSSSLDWAELVVGGDDREAYVTRHMGAPAATPAT